MKKMIGFGIIGTGAIARQHAMAIEECPGARIAAVCDTNLPRAEEFAQNYAVERIYGSVDEMLADPQVLAVSICTPSGTHGQISMAAAKAGKHILCEKPIETKAEKIDALVQAVKESGVKMECVYQRRFQPEAQKIKAALDSGLFGRVLTASLYMKYYRSPEYYKSAGWRATWELDGGGCLMNQGVHGVDLIAWFMGGVKRISAMTRTRLHPIEVEDAAAAAVEYENGAIGVIECTTCSNPAEHMCIDIYCENGAIRWNDKGIQRWILNGEDLTEQMAENSFVLDSRDDPTKVSHEGHGLLVADLVESIRENRAPSVGPGDARHAVDVILAIYRSSQEGRQVEV